MKWKTLKVWLASYYAEGWNVGLLALDAFVIGIIAVDCIRFTSSGLEIGAVYRMMAENFSADWIDWRLFIFWIVVVPIIIATSHTSLRKARAHSKKPRRIPRRWVEQLRRAHLYQSSLVVGAHLILALFIAHCAQLAAAMQNLSGRSDSILGWGFQSYWASIISFGSLFYASILVPAFQIALVKILGFRMGGISAHGLTGLTAEETPIKGLEHTHLSAHG